MNPRLSLIDTALALAVPLVFRAEGFEAQAYLDRAAKPPVWTIGHGTTRINGHPVDPTATCTREQADAWAKADLLQSALWVDEAVHITLTAPQLAAMTSFCYNVGIGHFRQSSVCEALNLGLLRVAADRLLEYDEAGGKVEAGLHTRRGRERALFLTGQMLPSVPVAPEIVRPEALSAADALMQAELDRIAVTWATPVNPTPGDTPT